MPASNSVPPRRRRLLKFAAFCAAAGVAIQFVPYGKDLDHKPTGAPLRFGDARVEALVARSCRDCHGRGGERPWYSRVAPVSWLLAHDVAAARRRIDFADFDARTAPREAHDVVERGEMPPARYLAMHPDAALSVAERKLIAESLRIAIRGENGGRGRGGDASDEQGSRGRGGRVEAGGGNASALGFATGPTAPQDPPVPASRPAPPPEAPHADGEVGEPDVDAEEAGGEASGRKRRRGGRTPQPPAQPAASRPVSPESLPTSRPAPSTEEDEGGRGRGRGRGRGGRDGRGGRGGDA